MGSKVGHYSVHHVDMFVCVNCRLFFRYALPCAVILAKGMSERRSATRSADAGSTASSTKSEGSASSATKEKRKATTVVQDSSGGGGPSSSSAAAEGGKKEKKTSTAQGVEAGEAVSKDALEALQRSLQQVEAVLAHLDAQKLVGIEAAHYIMIQSIDVQRVAMLQQLKHYSDDEEPGTIVGFLRSSCESLSMHSNAVQLALAKGFGDVMDFLDEAGLEQAIQIARITLPAMSATDVISEFQTLYMKLVDQVSQHFVETDVFPLSKSIIMDVEKTDDSRLFHVDVLVQCANKYPDLAWQAIDPFRSILSAASTKLRVGATRLMFCLWMRLPFYFSREALLEEMMMLLVDEDTSVISATYRVLVDLIGRFDCPFAVEFVFPIIVRFVKDAPAIIAKVVAEKMGPLMWNMKPLLPDIPCGSWDVLVQLYRHFATDGSNVENRQLSAFNFPGVVASLPVEDYMNSLVLPLLQLLTTDANVTVRITLAGGIHEVSRLLCTAARAILTDPSSHHADVVTWTAAQSRANTEAAVALLPHVASASAVLTLLADQDMKVREKTMSKLRVVLQCHAAVLPAEAARSFYLKVAASVAAYEAVARTNWRKVALVFDEVSELPRMLPPRELVEIFLPMFIWHLQTGAAALNHVVTKTISVVVRLSASSGTDEDRKDTMRFLHYLTTTLCQAKQSMSRIAFLELFEVLAGCCSDKFTSIYLVPALQGLVGDKVPSVRLRLARLIPFLKSLPTVCKGTVPKLIAAFSRDPDPLVAAEAARTAALPVSRQFDADTDARLEAEEGVLVDGILVQRVVSDSAAKAFARSQLTRKKTLTTSLRSSSSMTATEEGGAGGAGGTTAAAPSPQQPSSPASSPPLGLEDGGAADRAKRTSAQSTRRSAK